MPKKDRARHRSECRDIVKAKELKRSRRLAESLSMQEGETKDFSSPTTGEHDSSSSSTTTTTTTNTDLPLSE